MTTTKQQKAAIEAPVDSHVVLEAVAGAGKTYVLERRVKFLVDVGINPKRILVLTFSKSQAEDMALRIFTTFPELKETALSDGLDGASQVTTIHAACFRILKEEGLTKLVTPSWRERSIIEGWVEDHGWTYYDKRTRSDVLVGWQSILYWINRAKTDYVKWTTNVLVDYFTDKVGREWSTNLACVAVYYQSQLRYHNELSFNDMLYEMEDRLHTDLKFRMKWAMRFTHIIVDEAQDTNAQAMRIVKLLNPVSLFVVGDPNQTLYRFNSAAPEYNIGKGFDDNFGGHRLHMTRNWRSHDTLLKRAERLLIVQNGGKESEQRLIEARPDAEEGPDLSFLMLNDPQEEAEYVVADIYNKIQADEYDPGSFFIMSRTNAQQAFIELELLNKGIPFVNLGVSSFFNQRIPKIIVAYMRLIAFPGDWDAYRIVYNVPSNRMMDRKHNYCSTRWLGGKFNNKLNMKATSVRDEVHRNRSARNKKGWSQWEKGADDLVCLLDELDEFDPEHNAGSFVSELMHHCLSRWMEEEYPLEQDASLSAYDDLAVVKEIAERFTIDQFLSYIDQLQNADKVDVEELVDFVLIGTIYRFKGLERKCVYTIGVSDGLLPHRFSMGADIPTDGVPIPQTSTIWDERNLAYVAITRAKEECYLTGVRSWPTMPNVELTPSCFIHELGLLKEEEVNHEV